MAVRNQSVNLEEGNVGPILDQYNIYVSSAEAISHKRQAANTYFLTINTLLAAYYGIQISSTFSEIYQVAVSLAGIVLCYTWYRLIRSYKDLNTAKFKVIHQIEMLLPLKPFDEEWEMVGRGENPKLYLQFTKVEMRIPWIFMAINFTALIMRIPW